MKAGNENKVSLHLLAGAVALALGAMACNGAISDEGSPSGGGPNTGSANNGGSSPGTGGVKSNPPPVGGAGGGGGSAVGGTLDSGRIDIHRLNNFEYDNTMRDLLGVDGMA